MAISSSLPNATVIGGAQGEERVLFVDRYLIGMKPDRGILEVGILFQAKEGHRCHLPRRWEPMGILATHSAQLTPRTLESLAQTRRRRLPDVAPPL
jgi:hypothetical protein